MNSYSGIFEEQLIEEVLYMGHLLLLNLLYHDILSNYHPNRAPYRGIQKGSSIDNSINYVFAALINQENVTASILDSNL